MDDAFLMGVLDSTANILKYFQPLVRRESVTVTVIGDRNPSDQLHDEVGPPRLCGATIDDPSDVRMIHQGQGVPLSVEPLDDLLGVHAGFDDLQRHLAANRLLLHGPVNHTHPAFTDLIVELVGTDVGADLLGDGGGLVDGGGDSG